MKKIFNKRSKRRGILLFLLFTVIFLGIFGYIGRIRTNSNKAAVNNNVHKEVSTDKYAGKMESIMEYGDRVTIVAHYPVIGNSTIDASILKTVENRISSFREEIIKDNNSEGELHIDYNSYIVDDKYISIAMTFEESITSYANIVMGIQNGVYDISGGNQLILGDVIAESETSKFIELIYEKIKSAYEYDEEDLKNNIAEYISSNPYNFYLNKEGIVIKFDEYSVLPGNYGTPAITLPYEEIKHMFKDGFRVGQVDSHMDIQQDTTQTIEKTENTTKRNIDPDKPMVALTFDDGPHPVHTKKILEALKKHNGAATFYVLGNRASAYGDLVQEIINAGSEVGNHSWSHSNYTQLSASKIKEDKDKTQQRIKQIIGNEPTTLRAPYGALNSTVRSSVGLPIILWSVDTNDWKHKDTDLIIKYATENIKDGDIILMHDIWGETANAVPEIAQKLTEQGFQLVTVSEMAEARNVEMENGNKYFSFKK